MIISVKATTSSSSPRRAQGESGSSWATLRAHNRLLAVRRRGSLENITLLNSEDTIPRHTVHLSLTLRGCFLRHNAKAHQWNRVRPGQDSGGQVRHVWYRPSRDVSLILKELIPRTQFQKFRFVIWEILWIMGVLMDRDILNCSKLVLPPQSLAHHQPCPLPRGLPVLPPSWDAWWYNQGQERVLRSRALTLTPLCLLCVSLEAAATLSNSTCTGHSWLLAADSRTHYITR